jgi:F420H(2)-dependent quinone reductase
MSPAVYQLVAKSNSLANTVLIPVLRSRAGRRLGRRLAVVEYVGRRTGQHHQLVAMYTTHEATVRIVVGLAQHKTWWRNFSTARPLQLRLAGRDHEATAHVVHEDGGVSVVAELS